jgi:hypothetical protein
MRAIAIASGLLIFKFSSDVVGFRNRDNSEQCGLLAYAFTPQLRRHVGVGATRVRQETLRRGARHCTMHRNEFARILLTPLRARNSKRDCKQCVRLLSG